MHQVRGQATLLVHVLAGVRTALQDVSHVALADDPAVSPDLQPVLSQEEIAVETAEEPGSEEWTAEPAARQVQAQGLRVAKAMLVAPGGRTRH
ncbi:hypothetical protein ADU59_28085 [Pararhizobium polonicum]|uniref:Uncharacterized protein n=1 Tax=Pararhizobium polonicum TaxID=1612624 RepID=A0A1C7NT60_9HYPH|nr:hypothetical protein ADU59_28085 [Pararhizobium polonicum]